MKLKAKLLTIKQGWGFNSNFILIPHDYKKKATGIELWSFASMLKRKYLSAGKQRDHFKINSCRESWKAAKPRDRGGFWCKLEFDRVENQEINKNRRTFPAYSWVRKKPRWCKRERIQCYLFSRTVNTEALLKSCNLYKYTKTLGDNLPTDTMGWGWEAWGEWI